MSRRQKSNQSAVIDRFAQDLIRLAEMFREEGPARDYQWWSQETPHTVYESYPSYQSGHKIFDKVVEGMLNLNPGMLSKSEVEWRLTYEFLEQCTIRPEQLSKVELTSQARDFLNKLVEFKAWQEVDFPIVNLLLEEEPVKLGHVTFVATTKEDIEQWQKDDQARLQGIADIHVIARINAPGDLEKALSYARTQVNRALDVLRILCFPFYPFTNDCRIGIIGEISFDTSTPLRISQRRFAAQFVGATPAYWEPELRKGLLSKLEQHQRKLVDKLILKTEDSCSNMEDKILDGIHWLGESTKPDTNRARFAKISFALETLIGGESQDEELKVRGVTAMLAERAAFIAGKDLDDRLAIDRSIRKYYGMRSDIVHGGKRDIILIDIDNFGILVRRIAFALLGKLDELGSNLSTVEKLESWVKTQRYTLPP